MYADARYPRRNVAEYVKVKFKEVQILRHRSRPLLDLKQTDLDKERTPQKKGKHKKARFACRRQRHLPPIRQLKKLPFIGSPETN